MTAPYPLLPRTRREWLESIACLAYAGVFEGIVASNTKIGCPIAGMNRVWREIKGDAYDWTSPMGSARIHIILAYDGGRYRFHKNLAVYRACLKFLGVKE